MAQTPSSAVLLLSAGLDSSYNLVKAIEAGVEIALALTFDYGQRAAIKEMEKSKALAALYRIPHRVVALDFFREFSKSALLSKARELPTGASVDISDAERSRQSAEKVWVANRNGVFINIAASIAESLKVDSVLVGFNQEEARTFPDNSVQFMEAAEKALSLSTANQIKVFSFSTHMTKREIVSDAKRLDLPLEILWPCYQGGEIICRECESCKRYLNAMT